MGRICHDCSLGDFSRIDLTGVLLYVVIGMDSPHYTVIVPMRHYDACQTVLVSLKERRPACAVEILVVEGSHPARQRNAALAQARGEIIVFLDNDCQLGEHYWQELERALNRPEVGVVGGPARLRADASSLEKIFHGLLTHPLVVGPVAARYRPKGEFRATRETEVILCNLVVRRSVFEKVGRFSPDLYPNEENEWLDRAQAAGAGLYYHPSLQVFRPQRATFPQMGLALIRYGMGRTRQFRVSGWHFTVHQLLPLGLIAAVFVFIAWPAVITGMSVLVWLAVGLVVGATASGELSWGQRIISGLLAPLIPLTYIVGQIIGWFRLGKSEPEGIDPITIRDEQGIPVSR